MELVRFCVMLALAMTGMCLMMIPFLETSMDPRERPAPRSESEDESAWDPGSAVPAGV